MLDRAIRAERQLVAMEPELSPMSEPGGLTHNGAQFAQKCHPFGGPQHLDAAPILRLQTAGNQFMLRKSVDCPPNSGPGHLQMSRQSGKGVWTLV
jgi:hypothetical protein